MKRIVQVCSAHPSDDGRVNQRASRGLAQAGYEVHLIATDPATAPYDDHGVRIHPLPAIPSSRERIKRRHAVAEMAAALKPDLYQVHEPELLGAVLRVAGRTPVIFDVHELYVDVLLDRDWIPRPLRPVLRWGWDRMERGLIQRCAGVVVVTEGVAARYRPMRDDVVIVANFPDLSDHLNQPKVERDPKLAIFSGTLSENRGLFELVEAYGILRDRGIEARLRIAGKGSDSFLAELDRRIETLGLGDRIQRTGPYQRLDGLAMSNAASIGLVPHLPYGNNMVAWPVKMLDYMALGLPLVYSDLPPHRELVAGHEVGVEIDATRPESIADGLAALLLDPSLAARLGEAGQSLARTRLNWEPERAKLVALVERLVR